MAIRCPNCGNENPDDYVYCDECGSRLQTAAPAAVGGGGSDYQSTDVMPAASAAAAPDATEMDQPEMAVEDAQPASPGNTVRCPTCGAENLPGAAFCDECGASLIGVQAATGSATADTAADATTDTAPPAMDYGPTASAASSEDYSQYSRPVESTAAADTEVEAPVPATEETMEPEDTETAAWTVPATPAAESGMSTGTPDYSTPSTSATDYSSTTAPDFSAPSTSYGDTSADTTSSYDSGTSTMAPAEEAGTVATPSMSMTDTSDDTASSMGGTSTAEQMVSSTSVAPPVTSAPTSTPAGSTSCANCGAPLRPDAVFCTRCGTPVAQKPALTCPTCGNQLNEDDVFCARCGTRVDSLTQAASQPPVAAPATAVGSSMGSSTVTTTDDSSSSIVIEPVREETPISMVPPPVQTSTPEPAPVMDAQPVVEERVETVAPAQPVAPAMPATPATPAVSSSGTAPFTSTPSVPSATGLRLEVVSSGQPITLDPNKQELLVGREDPLSDPPIFPDVDLTPHGGEEGGVSRRHARIFKQGNDYFVEDLNSTNYTKLNGQRIAPRTPLLLVDGSRIDFGRVATVFRR